MLVRATEVAQERHKSAPRAAKERPRVPTGSVGCEVDGRWTVGGCAPGGMRGAWQGGGSKDPGEFGRISKKVCIRADLGRRQGAADLIASRIPPGPDR